MNREPQVSFNSSPSFQADEMLPGGDLASCDKTDSIVDEANHEQSTWYTKREIKAFRAHNADASSSTSRENRRNMINSVVSLQMEHKESGIMSDEKGLAHLSRACSKAARQRAYNAAAELAHEILTDGMDLQSIWDSDHNDGNAGVGSLSSSSSSSYSLGLQQGEQGQHRDCKKTGRHSQKRKSLLGRARPKVERSCSKRRLQRSIRLNCCSAQTA